MSATYYRNVNPDLLGWMPLSARRILEIGCGEGALAAAYRQRNPAAHYTAVEIHPPSAAVARGRVDRLIEADIETMSDAEVGGPFDLALMGDVLEHLADPARMLARLHRLLAPGGALVVCVPNIAHWSALRELMSGRWPAQDSGLFDRTHLRFFTRESLQEALQGAGFRVLKARPRQFLLDEAEAGRWIPALAEVAGALGLDRVAFESRARTLQYVVAAVKPGPGGPAPLTVIHQVAMAPYLMDARTRLPAAALDAEPLLSVMRDEQELRLKQLPLDQPKILVVQRLAILSRAFWIGSVAQIVAAGWLLVAECDDDPALMARIDPRGTDPGLFDALLASVHAVQTSTERLAARFGAVNPEVAVFPNAAFSLPPLSAPREGPPRVFFGALNREGFSRPVAAALAPAIARFPEAEFVVVHDRAFFEALPTARKTFHKAMPYEAYLDLMGTCDIALMPLEGSEPELAKSDIKFVEASSRGVATIASPAVYGASIRHGETGLIAETVADWPERLGELLADPAMRRRLAEAAYAAVREERMFAHQVARQRDWYRSLWTRRADLNAALIARNPDLEPAIAEARARLAAR